MTATIACVDVGQGDCTVAVDDDTGEALLIDCRGGHHSEAITELSRLKMSQLRAALVTHTHQDHFGGVLDVLEELAERFTGTLHFNHDTLMVTPVAGEDRAIAGRKLRALINRASEFGDRVRRAEDQTPPGDVGCMTWQILAPNYQDVLDAVSKRNPNLASGVVVLKVGSDAIVIGGDAQMPTWERIATQVPKGAVFRWPHHGGILGSDSAHARLRELVSPAIVVVSVGAANAEGHPTEAFFAAVGGKPGRLLCTQATPACVAGRGAGRVCAGTITIRADGRGNPTVTPAAHHHAGVIASLGNGQCTSQAVAA
jgi:beta-lactamase superfamily II metal-dependent hydrolase